LALYQTLPCGIATLAVIRKIAMTPAPVFFATFATFAIFAIFAAA
jgi:hypothetical protein